MTIYFIGALITLGFISEMNNESGSKRISFWGALFLASIWPFFWGMRIYDLIKEKEDD